VERRIYDGSLQLKLARTRTKVLSVGQRLKDGGAMVPAVDTRDEDAVTAPVEFNAIFPDEGNNQSGDSDCGVKGSGGDAESLSGQNSQSGVVEIAH
jgi:hypothetical protein